MKRLALIVLGVATALTVPTVASAVKPSPGEKRLAKAECLAERGATAADRVEFRVTYGKKALRNCIRVKAREFAVERSIAVAEARTSCRAEQASDPVGFREEYPSATPLHMCIRLELAP
jgi:hypothetical protein